MGGGPSTASLVVGAAEAGAIGFLAGAYKPVPAILAEMAEVRRQSDNAFGVNLFVPGPPARDTAGIASYLDTLRADVAMVGARLGDATWDDDGFEAKIEALLADPPPILSFTFGCPPPEIIAAAKSAGSIVALSVTSPEEASVAAAAGAEALCVQGVEAGGHRACFENADQPGDDYGLLSLIGEVARVTDLPQIAAGGVMSPNQVRAVLAAGALAAQCGTAFLRCPESGAHRAHKEALADPRYTVAALTRAFSGRPARGIVNRFLVEHPDAPAAYPEINRATRPMRSAAAERGDTDHMSLWAGQGYRAAREAPAAEIVDYLCSKSAPAHR